MNSMEIDVTDILCDKPLIFDIGHKQYEVHPASLGESLIRAQVLKQMGINARAPQMVTTDIMLKTIESKSIAARFIAICTLQGKEAINAREVAKRERIISKALSVEELTTLIIAILAMDKTSATIIQLGIDKEQDKARRIQDIKNLKDNNTIVTGGVSVYGSLISTACEKYGWTYDECVWGISYANLRLMLADSVNTHILDDSERRMLAIPRRGEKVVDAGDVSNIEQLTKEYLNQ